MNPVFASKFPERNPMNDQRAASLPSNPQTAPDAAREDVTSSAKGPSVATAKETTPTPQSDPRKTATAPTQPSRLSKLGAWLGISRKNDDQKQPANSGAQPKAQTAQQPAPHDAPAAKAIPASKPAQDDAPDSGSMKGATPILGAGGLSFR
jgi:hypothetical protein